MLYGYLPQLLAGTWVTIQLAFTALLFGTLLGFLFALAKLSNNKVCYIIAEIITSFIRGLPELLIIFMVYFAGTIVLAKLWGSYVNVSPFFSGALALAFIFSAYLAETLRGAYLAIEQGQLIAARAYGFTAGQCFWRITLPQMWHYALPGFGNLWLVLIKDTAIVSLIGLSDLMSATHVASAATAKPFIFYLTAGAIYLALTSLSMIILRYATQRSAMRHD
ncbi:MAG: ABC transporter permease subunit [Gammaproteobacteria bacterium]|nr:ABC transporter permease subunit [Gammaproteobacteria bacterium]